MNTDGRLSWVLHVLLHLAHTKAPMTSDDIASTLHTHPVVIRRELAALRELGYVRSAKGHGGGWSLACDLAKLTLHDVYVALGEPALFAIGHGAANPRCLVERAVNTELASAKDEAARVLLARFKRVTLHTLSQHFTKDFRHAH